MKLKAPRGTQDILPERTPAWIHLETRFREVLARYGFGEIRTPIFESTELFQRGVGEATDIVQKEMYTFLDRKGRSLTLRPEGTASVARAFVEHNLHAGVRPAKVFYIGPMFRYERPQAGRYRQHQQIGAELIGSPSPSADFEMISLLVDLLGSVGLAGVRVLLNSVGDSACRPGFTEALRHYLEDHAEALCPDCVRRVEMNPLRVLDCKVPGCREVAAGMPSIQEHLCPDCRAHQDRLLASLRRAEVEVVVDDRLVRGLDYYTRTVFEIQHGGLGAQSAVGGGGRYDGLVREVGGGDIPAVGFSTGVERILLALEAEGVALPGVVAPQVAIVVAGQESEREAALVLARRLRRRYSVDVDLLERGMGGQMKAANRLGARVTVVVGEGELSRGDWTVKNMESGEQVPVPDAALEDHLETLFARP